MSAEMTERSSLSACRGGLLLVSGCSASAACAPRDCRTTPYADPDYGRDVLRSVASGQHPRNKINETASRACDPDGRWPILRTESHRFP